jgi:hypothetical protein
MNHLRLKMEKRWWHVGQWLLWLLVLGSHQRDVLRVRLAEPAIVNLYQIKLVTQEFQPCVVSHCGFQIRYRYMTDCLFFCRRRFFQGKQPVTILSETWAPECLKDTPNIDVGTLLAHRRVCLIVRFEDGLTFDERYFNYRDWRETITIRDLKIGLPTNKPTFTFSYSDPRCRDGLVLTMRFFMGRSLKEYSG